MDSTPEDGTSEARLERPAVRIMAFLAFTQPLPGCEWLDNHLEEGQRLVTRLALAQATGQELPDWTTAQCATVVAFLDRIVPVDGSCYCDGDPPDSRAALTCGYHEVLGHLRACLLAMPAEVVDNTRKVQP